MASTMPKLLHVSLYQHRSGQILPVRQGFRRSSLMWDPIGVKGCGGRIRNLPPPCRSFRSEESEENKENRREFNSKKGVNRLLHAIRSTVWRFSKPSSRREARFREAMEELEKKLSAVTTDKLPHLLFPLSPQFPSYNQ